MADAYRRGGEHLLCHPGCTPCCVGVFPISQQDAERLRTGLAVLDRTDPERAARVSQRVLESFARIAPHFPGDLRTGIVSEEQQASGAFDDFANDEPCPVLDPVTGTCDLYEHRPLLCRTFGPPARTEQGHLAHCELCFSHATTGQIAAAELDPDLPAAIRAADAAYNAAHGLEGETLVACALNPTTTLPAPETPPTRANI